jgi:hypothetical protein
MIELPRSRQELNAAARARYRDRGPVGGIIHTLASASWHNSMKIHNLPANIEPVLAAAATEFWIVGEVFITPVGDSFAMLDPDNIVVKIIPKPDFQDDKDFFLDTNKCKTIYQVVNQETKERTEIDCIHILRRVSPYDVRGTSIINPDGSIQNFLPDHFEESFKKAFAEWRK